MNIGNIKTPNNIFLAPMAGVTDMTFRILCKSFGCGLIYTEMISAKGIFYKSENTEALTAIDPRERPAAIQIFGSDPKIMAYASAKIEEDGADLIDINMGCPTPKIVNNGDGSALMKDPLLAGDIIKAVVNQVKIPVTVKIRRGWDENTVNAVQIGRIAEQEGAAAIAVHGRTREQFYTGKADWNIIREVKKALTIPVIGNGDIYSPQDAKSMMEETGCDAVMIGRGAQGNPWIFKRIEEYLSTGILLEEPTAKERIEMLIRHMNMLVQYKGEYIGIKEMRKHASWYLKSLPGSCAIKNQIFTMTQKNEIERFLNSYLDSLI
ncbi:MAG: tRNA dihydrouridine synthase DusB [Lutispora sp.]|nr:tRNA dihydrouridine synthase DusB [Lutispora sp.]MDD4833436.1 tRNA dihydrouridine synthase DusB [Lutispora sp.]